MSQQPTIEEKKKLGFWPTTSLAVGNMIGSGVFLLPAALAFYGGISLFGWIFTVIGALFLALVFSRLSKLITKGRRTVYLFTGRVWRVYGFSCSLGVLDIYLVCQRGYCRCRSWVPLLFYSCIERELCAFCCGGYWCHLVLYVYQHKKYS